MQTKPLVYARDADSFAGVLGMTVTPTAAPALVAQLDDPAWSTPLNRCEDEAAQLLAEGQRLAAAGTATGTVILDRSG